MTAHEHTRRRIAPAIEKAGAAHATLLAAIHAEAFQPEECWDARIIAGQLSQPGVFGFLHQQGGMILARQAADEAEILTLGVVPMARRCGIGRALLLQVCGEARRRGATRLFLEVAVTNSAARSLYEALGFRKVGLRREYYADGEHALTLALPLGKSASRAGSSSR